MTPPRWLIASRRLPIGARFGCAIGAIIVACVGTVAAAYLFAWLWGLT